MSAREYEHTSVVVENIDFTSSRWPQNQDIFPYALWNNGPNYFINESWSWHYYVIIRDIKFKQLTYDECKIVHRCSDQLVILES